MDLKFLIGFMVTFPLLLSASYAEVRLMDNIVVEAPRVELGEIAYIEADDPELQEVLMRITVCDVPRGSSPRIISAYRVKAILEEMGLSENCEVFGAQTTARLDTRLVEDEELVALVKEWVDANTPLGFEAELEVVRPPKGWQIPAGRGVEITVDPVQKKLKGNVTFSIYALLEGEVFAQTRLRTRVALFGDAFVLREPLKRGELLTADHIERQRTEITAFRGTPIAESHQVIGLSARRDLKPGAVLDFDQFEKPVIIRRGSVNRIVVRNGNIELSIAAAEALQDAREGEIVMFANPMNQREPLKAKAVRSGFALIELR